MSLTETLDALNESKLTDSDKSKVSHLLLLVSKSSAAMSPFELRLAREAAGLSVGQVARLLAVDRSVVMNLESGDWIPGAEMVGKLDEIYGLDGVGQRCPPPQRFDVWAHRN